MGERKEKAMSKRCATITARMDISLPNAYMRGKKKTMIREISLTNATKK
jgi:hypothetical protein